MRPKLSRADVVEIKRLLRSGHTQSAVAARFGVSDKLICSINVGRRWNDVPGATGRHSRESPGERNGRAILTEVQVREIRRRRESILVQAARYGVAESTIEAARYRQTWRHI